MHNTKTYITVRYCETDKMGIVHHSNYFKYFEEARTDFLSLSGVSYSEVERKGILFPLISAQSDFISGITYEDKIVIDTQMILFTGVRLKIEYEVKTKTDNRLIAKGSTTHAITDKQLKPISMRKLDRPLYDLMKSQL